MCVGLKDNIEMNSDDGAYGVKIVVGCWDFVDMTGNWRTEYGQDAPSCDKRSEKARNIQRKRESKAKKYIYRVYVCGFGCIARAR